LKENPASVDLKTWIVKLGTLIMLMRMGNFLGIVCSFARKKFEYEELQKF